MDIHVTRISDRGVYGHETRHCDPGGCAAADEWYFRHVDPADVEVGECYELADDGTVAYRLGE